VALHLLHLNLDFVILALRAKEAEKDCHSAILAAHLQEILVL
jgi:hypothetical protein